MAYKIPLPNFVYQTNVTLQYFLQAGFVVLVDLTYVEHALLMYVSTMLDFIVLMIMKQKRYSVIICQGSSENPLDHQFQPLTRFGEEELHQAYCDMNGSASHSADAEIRSPLPKKITDLVINREVLKFSYQFPERFFGQLWSYGIPLVIMGVGAKLQLSWTPEYFIHNHGHKKCTLEETSGGNQREATVAEFFTSYGNYNKFRPVEKLKVGEKGNSSSASVLILNPKKDWPPTAGFEEVFPDLYKSFMAAVPMKEYTRADGSLNLASNFPRNTICPDLGEHNMFF